MRPRCSIMPVEGNMIRKAKIADIKHIHKLLLLYSKNGILLARSMSDLYDQLRDFFVAVDDDTREITGVCSLHFCWDDIAEVRSLAVCESHKGLGVGCRLVRLCIEEAASFGICNLFVLTYVPDFFTKLGFHPVEKSVLPHKVWSDCINCIKFPDCDEQALMIEIGSKTNSA